MTAAPSNAARWLRNRATARPGCDMSAALAEIDDAIKHEHVGRACCVILDEYVAAVREQSTARQRHVLEHAVLLCSDWLHSTRPSTVHRHNRVFRLRQATGELLDELHRGRATELLAARVVALLKDLAGDAL